MCVREREGGVLGGTKENCRGQKRVSNPWGWTYRRWCEPPDKSGPGQEQEGSAAGPSLALIVRFHTVI